jgi:hypothetical protein
MFYHNLPSFFNVVSKYYLDINRFNHSLLFAWCSESGHCGRVVSKILFAIENHIIPPPGPGMHEWLSNNSISVHYSERRKYMLTNCSVFIFLLICPQVSCPFSAVRHRTSLPSLHIDTCYFCSCDFHTRSFIANDCLQIAYCRLLRFYYFSTVALNSLYTINWEELKITPLAKYQQQYRNNWMQSINRIEHSTIPRQMLLCSQRKAIKGKTSKEMAEATRRITGKEDDDDESYWKLLSAESSLSVITWSIQQEHCPVRRPHSPLVSPHFSQPVKKMRGEK